MITAVDTSILLDVFIPDPRFGPASREALVAARAAGGLTACDVVWAEVCAWFPTADPAREALHDIGVTFSAIDVPAALAAGDAWRDYRRTGGPRTRHVPDFLIGAHATTQAERLLTRDRGFFRTYFAGLEIVDPTA